MNALPTNQTNQASLNAGIFAEILKDTQLGKYAIQLADARQMPRDTTILTALGIVSSPVSMVYNVAYQYGGQIPTSLYVATEQPPSTGKSGVLMKLLQPIQQSIKAMNTDAAKFNAALNDDDETPPKSYYKAFVSDTTPEALDGILAQQSGHFCLASAEQGLINTALGVSYGKDKASNNDLILKGFSGDWHSSTRITRLGYDGFVFGAVTVIAQGGTIDTILEQSNGTGIAERFIMLAEPTLLGNREHLKARPQPCSELSNKYANAMEALVLKYQQAKDAGATEYQELEKLSLTGSDWHKLNILKQEVEPLMLDGAKYSHEMLRGVVGKLDQRIMKLAACLHTVESLIAGKEVGRLISSRYVDMAIQIALLSIEQVYTAMREKGLIGMSAEKEAVYRIVSKKDPRGILWNDLRNHAKGVQPFKSYSKGGGFAAKLQLLVADMLQEGLLKEVDETVGGKPSIRYFAA
ncbi:DUF3987 domain-containing protein [Marinospirillum insulare]|uniref:DUF3987 domain-containing protein n=1 Tax=Marinospirillum insulare TaxID=217169 RepID=A0ABQ5ZYL7_9GAMM|nr:DUF3987 domain-containing protein [Marinospirillum insulare]GLR63751.1 hypothetical protein GCM10007878_11860 [Marinospirillum insulare]